MGPTIARAKDKSPPKVCIVPLVTCEPVTDVLRRKRAKTEDEKEQRRVERVLRNRRAAQSSRERKRLEVEALEGEKQKIERRNKDLELQLENMAAHNAMLEAQIREMRGQMTVFARPGSLTPPPQKTEPHTPITFSKELFQSRNRLSFDANANANATQTQLTVNPASLSPEVRPVDQPSNASFSDMTQHPAAMLCDLPCQSEEHQPWMAWDPTASAALYLRLAVSFFLTLSSEVSLTFLRPLTQISASLRTGCSLSPTPSILHTIIWMLTTRASLTPAPTMPLTSTTSSTTTSPSLRPMFSLRICLLQRLLACSPHMARPLRDATMGQLRQASEEQLACDCLSLGAGPGDRYEDRRWDRLSVLMALLWAIDVFVRQLSESVAPDECAGAEMGQASSKLGEAMEVHERRDRGNDVTISEGTSHQKCFAGWDAVSGV